MAGVREDGLFHATSTSHSRCVLQVSAMPLLLRARGVQIDRRGEHGRTLILLASRAGRRDVTEVLIRCGAAINLADNSGRTALWCAACNGHADCARALIAAGAGMY